MLALFLLAIAVFASPVARSCAEPANDYIFSLNSDNPYGGGWTVENSNGSIRAPAIVPGGIYSDLMRAGVIGDVYFKDNDVNTRWVSKMDWTFNRTFTVSSDILEKETVDIVFHGLDTIAYIIINDHPVAMTDNMFVRYKYNIKEYLLQGENAISVQFESPVLAAATLSEKEAVAPECVPEVYKGECHANQLRKMQASFSWDWGPALPSVGIWKAVNLEAYNSAVIRDIITETKLLDSEPAWELSLRVLLDAAQGADEVEGHLEADVALDNGVKIRTYEFLHQKVLQNRAVERVLTIKISDANVKLWWPNGYGDQALYNVTVTFQSTQFVDEYYFKTIKVGFRTVELIQEQLSDGLSFYFKVNSYAMFMKGSNWIPAKILPENGDDKDTVDHLLQSAKDIHMNMLRVWGGGVYESDYFYQKCDELGILVWQDMMFACSMYPANSKYLSSVSEEIEQVIKRLQHHPSIAIWAGNNENEAALRDNWYGTANNFSAYKDGYISLYVDTIRPIVQRVDPTRTYVVSSPSNGLQSEADGYIAQNPGDSRFGDTHYYNYLQNLWSMDTFSKSRFCSEFGFQSIPSLATFLTATDDADDVKIGSAFMEHRQHSDFNNYASMALQIDMQFGALNEDDPNYFSVFQYYSQVIQAWAYKTESEFYRQSRFDWMTMGALYWQLNDVWQAPTWSGIEFGGAWKMLHYFGKDFFSPVLISPRQLASNEVVVRIISDRLERIENATITIDIFNWYNLTPLSTQTSQVNILPLSADRYGPNIILPPTEGRKQMFYRFSLRDSEANMLGPYNYIFPSALKDIQGYSAPNVTVQLVGGENPVYDLDVTTDGVGLFVWILVDRDVGWLSENGFVMSERTKRIQIHVPNQKNLSKLNNLKVQVYNQNHFAKKVEVKQVV